MIPEIKIVAAAIMWKGVVYTGVRHGDIIQQIVTLGQIAQSEKPITGDMQGFIDSRGNYWTRDHAWQIAYEACQINKNHGELLSEDLW